MSKEIKREEIIKNLTEEFENKFKRSPFIQEIEDDECYCDQYVVFLHDKIQTLNNLPSTQLTDEEIKAINILIEICKRYEKKHEGLFDWEFHFVNKIKNAKWMRDKTKGEETPYCPYCGHKKGYKVSTDINSGKECKNPFCKKQ